MSAPLECPEFESWEVLLEDAAPSGEWDRYERHLEACRACQARLDRAEGQPEMLRRAGRQFGHPTRRPGDPTLARVLEQLLEARTTGRRHAAGDLYFLRPSERADLLGTLGDYEVTGVVGE